MTVIFLQHLISQVCISKQISVIVRIEFAHQITYEAPPRQNIFKGELATEKSVDKKSVLHCIALLKMKMIEMTTNRLRRTIIRWTFGSSVSNLIIKYVFFKKIMIISQIETFVPLRWSKECLSQEFQKPLTKTDHAS